MTYKSLLCLFCSMWLIGCKSHEPVTVDFAPPALERMKSLKLEASLTNNMSLQNIPSASGIEFVQDAYYVIGDDSPYLFKLDERFGLVEKYTLFDSGKVQQKGRIAKAIKPDLESITRLTYGRDELLLILGSGASPARNKGFIVNLSNKMAVQELDLGRFYTFLKRVLKIETEGVLNIEALAMDKAYTYLLQRPLGNGVNVLFRFNSDEFKNFILRDGDIPAVAVYHFTLPGIGQTKSGFSGAYALGDKLFITASVEDTPNAIDDGEVLGSLLGVIDLNALPYATNSANPLAVPAVQLEDENGTVFKGKVESLVVKETGEKNRYQLVMVTDDDQGGSKLLAVELKID